MSTGDCEANSLKKLALDVPARLSSEPCPWCGEYFPLIDRKQKHHTQSTACTLNRNAEYMRQRRTEKPSAQSKQHRYNPNGRRRTRRSARVFDPTTTRQIEHPRAFANHILRRSFSWLNHLYPDDVAQTLELTYLEIGINPDAPACINPSYFSSALRRQMYQTALDFGAIRDNQTRRWKFPEYGLTAINMLAIHAKSNWQTTWRAA